MAINFEKLSILVVEDNRAMFELIKTILKGLGVKTIYSAGDGDSGFHSFRIHNPDIIILDWEMPGKNGLELTREIRRDTLSPNRMVPVIILTGYSAPKRVAEARDCGATEFLVKPFTAESLVSRLTHVINRPRDFVELESFFGPDRRRKTTENYKGPARRKSDSFEIEFAPGSST